MDVSTRSEDLLTSQTGINRIGDLFGSLFAEDESNYQEFEVVDDPLDDDGYDDTSEAPSYLLTAILPGHQTGWGRRVRYDPDKLIRLKLDFQPIGTLSTDSISMIL
jgi:hypothetical protein